MTMILQSNQSTRTVNTKNPKSNLRLVPNPFRRQHTVCSVDRWSGLDGQVGAYPERRKPVDQTKWIKGFYHI